MTSFFLTLICQIFPNPLPKQEETVFHKEPCSVLLSL
nr:MAG TPA: hypothetical protein [Caudoviricetes sp.]